MKAFAITSKGTEYICALEVKELTGSKAIEKERAVIFDTKSYQDLCKLVYLGQSISKAGILLAEFDFTDDTFFKKMNDAVKSSPINEWLHDGITFKAECMRFGEHNFGSVDASQEAGACVLRNADKKIKVDLKTPDLYFLVFVVDSHCYLGIDFAGIDLFNRDYKIFSHRESLSGAIAYSLVRLSGWGGKGMLIDPFCGGATIPIEAAVFQTGFSLNYFRKDKLVFAKMELGFDQKKLFDEIDKKAKMPDKANVFGSDMLLSSVNASAKNAKIAGMSKAVDISRIDIEWLDTKFEENSVAFIVSDMPKQTKMTGDKFMEKLCKEFFYRLDFIMKKKNAKIIVFTNSIDELKKHCEQYGFKLQKSHEIWQRKEKMNVYEFGR